jgi:hypothetical protein
MLITLILLFASTIPSTSTSRPIVEIDSHSVLFDKQPKLGSSVKIIYKVTPKESKENIRVVFRYFTGVKPIKGDTVLFCNTQKGVSKKFIIEVKYFSTPASFRADFGGNIIDVIRYQLNAKSGEFGSMKDIQICRPIEYLFNPNTREFDKEMYNFENGRWQKNRGIIDTIRALEPKLTDSMSLVLYADLMKVTFPSSVGTNWKNKVKYLITEGWQKYTEESDRIKFLKFLSIDNEMFIKAKRNLDKLNQNRLKQEMAKLKKAHELKWFMWWVIPAIILGMLLIVLLFIRSKKQGRAVTSKRFDKIIAYAIYILIIGIALYFAWPYLRLTNTQPYIQEEKIPDRLDQDNDANIRKDTIPRLPEVPSQVIIDRIYSEFEKAGLSPSYSKDHIKLISTRVLNNNSLEITLKWITGYNWIDEKNAGEGILIKMLYEYSSDPPILGNMVRKPISGHCRFDFDPRDPYHRDTKFYLRPIKETISEKEARKKLFSGLSDNEKFFDIYIELNLLEEAASIGKFIYLVGKYNPRMACSYGIKVDLETGRVFNGVIIRD